MIKYSKIDNKLEYAGLSSLDITDFAKFKRVSHILIKSSDEQADYVIRKICETNPYVAAECTAETKYASLYCQYILDAINKSDIPYIYKLLAYYRFNKVKAFGAIPDNISFENVEIDKLFLSWTDFCSFISSVLSTSNCELPWVLELFKKKSMSISSLHQNRTESRKLFNLILKKQYFTTLQYVYQYIGVDNYYSITEHQYEEIQQIFSSDEVGLREQMKYCWIDSKKRSVNLFNSFHIYNPEAWENPLAAMCAVMYEYQVSADSDPDFNNRISRTLQFDLLFNKIEKNEIWRRPIAENLINCAKICMQEKRDVSFFLAAISKANVFSFKKSLSAGLSIIRAERIQLIDMRGGQLLSYYVNEFHDISAIDLYLNSFLKLILSFDDAMRIIYNAIPADSFERYLQNTPFPAKIAHKDSTEVIIRLRNLSSRAYTPQRDMVLCEDVEENDSIYVKFFWTIEHGLFVNCIGKSEAKIRETPNYSDAAQECIQIINQIAERNYTDADLAKLDACSDIPMYYVKESFDVFLDSLRRINDNNSFMYTILHLYWNRKYYYEAGKTYDVEDFDFFSNHKQKAYELLKEKVQHKLSKSNAEQIYMNSFLKLAFAPDEFDLFTKEELYKYFKKYSFVEKLSKQGIWSCCSVKDFSSLSFSGFPDNSKYARLDSCILHLGETESEDLQLVFSEKETNIHILPKRIDRLKRAYDSISKHTSVRFYEYEYIRMVSPDFYRNDQITCQHISSRTIRATNIRYKTFEGLKTMINNLGPSNIYGAEFFPLSQFSNISRFSKRQDGQYDYAIRLCHSYIRCSSKISEALKLYSNTYVKTCVPFDAFEKLCAKSTLIKDTGSESIIIVVTFKPCDEGISINCIDVSVRGLQINMDYITEKQLKGAFYAELEVMYNDRFEYHIRKLISLDRKTIYIIPE